jgi:hypothetical protein
MGIFGRHLTPKDCIERISNAMNELESIRTCCTTTPKGTEYKADWDANRKYAEGHLTEAWLSLGWALNGLECSNRLPTHEERIVALTSEVNRLENALAAAEAEVNRFKPLDQMEGLAAGVRRA